MANGSDFKPQGSYSAPTLQSQYVLKTEQAQQVHRRCFEGAARALYTVDVIARALAHRNNAFSHADVMKAVESLILKLEKEISDERDRFVAILKAAGQEGMVARYDNAATFTFTISTPLIMRLAHIIQSFDEMLVQAQTAWLLGVLPSDRNDMTGNERKRQLMRVVRKLQAMATDARAKARKSPDAAEIARTVGEIGEENALDQQTAAAVSELDAAAA